MVASSQLIHAFRRPLVRLGITAVALLLPLGCSTHLLRGQIEKRIATRLRSLIGPANHYSVRIYDTRDAELVVGSIRRLTVEGSNVLVGGVIRLDRLRLEASGIRFRGGPDDLARVKESFLAVEISQAALNDYLEKERPEDEAHATLHDGAVKLSGVLRLLGARVPVEATGIVEVVDERQVVFRARSVHAPELRLPEAGAALVERQVNPLVDVALLDWPVRLSSIRVEEGKVTLEGALDLHRMRE